MLVVLSTYLTALLGRGAPASSSCRRSTRERGQASVEYALVLLGGAIVGTLVVAWAAKSQMVGDLFDHVLDMVKGKAK